MTQVITNGVSGITPTIWSTMVQVPLYKSLVALEVASMKLSDTVKFADRIQVPTFGSLSVQTYTPGTTISATAQQWNYDTLVVSSFKHVTFYVDDARNLQLNVDSARELATEAAYQLKNQIDTDVFKNITGADGFTNYGADSAGLGLGGSAHRPVSAGSATIINLFANARKVLRQNNVEEVGDWAAVITPQIAAYLETKAASVGFNVADATLRNGYAGDFMGFQVFISNNLPSGKCSAIASTISGAAVSATTCKSIYFGRKGTIDVVMQRMPALEIRKKDDMIGSNFITWTVYGSSVFRKNRSRGLNVAVQSGFY
jgi:hypothetical protein